MKTFLYILLISLIGLSACTKDESILPISSSPKLLVSIKENNQLVAEFKYDTLNRLIQLINYYDTVPYAEFYQYNSENQLTCRTYDGFHETYTYGSDGKLQVTEKFYNTTGKEWKIEYEYSKDKITKGITYFDGLPTGYVIFKYDSRGNTIERTEYSNSTDMKGMRIEQYKLEYDSGINPVKNLSKFPVDMVQNNNTTYFYHYMIIMSSLPPEYQSTYEYDTLGIPTSEFRDSRTFTYSYIDKKGD